MSSNDSGQVDDPFQAIRPYSDSEVSSVLNRLVRNNELIDAIVQYQFPWLPKWVRPLVRPMLKIALGAKVGEIETIYAFQMLIAGYMSKMIARTTRKLSFSGIDQLEKDESYLFVSNHRDIAMDPAFVNWALHQQGMQTVRIAIGDNLLKKPYVSDLMRLNKSFIVKRGVRSRTEAMADLLQLSEYIDHSIVSGHSVWIAQREGRSKNGNDQTDPALLKMFFIAHRKKRSFVEMVNRLNIVPVSIAYEYDPCDRVKAKELAAIAENGKYEKTQYEDIESIVKGITGYKGHVYVHFGDKIQGEFSTPEALAEEIDRQIHLGYYLHATNIAAAEEDEKNHQQLFERMSDMSPAEADFFKAMYATPVINQRKYQASSQDDSPAGGEVNA